MRPLARAGTLVTALPTRWRPGAVGEVLQPPVGSRRQATRRGVGVRRTLTLLLLSTVILFLGRTIWDSVIDRLEARRDVHADGSSAESGVRAERRPLASVRYRTLDGREVCALVDAGRLDAFVRERIGLVEAARGPLRVEAGKGVEEATGPTFAAMADRVDGFLDWYLSWGTGYELLYVGTLSAASHALAPRVTDLREAVTLDLERHVERRYRDQVLQPEAADPALREAYAAVLAAAHERVLGLVAELDRSFQEYLARASELLDAEHVPAQASLTLDWAGRVRRLTLPDLGASLIDPVRGAGLAAGGALAGAGVGRAAGQALGEGLAARAASPGGARLGARLAGPVAGRVITGVAGASAGAAGGPLGAALGGALGLGVDYAIASASASLQRPEVEAAVRASLAAHRDEWVGLMRASLDQAVDTWVDDLQAHLAEPGAL